MANRIVSVHTGIYGMGIYAIMLPSSGFSVAHCVGFLMKSCSIGSQQPCIRLTHKESIETCTVVD